MSDTGMKSTGRFIPTLTEVIEQADLLNPQQQVHEPAHKAVAEPRVEPRTEPRAEPRLEPMSKPEGAVPVPVEEEPAATSSEPITTGKVFVGNPFPTTRPGPKVEKEAYSQSDTGFEPEPVLAKDEDLLKSSQDIFSSLSRNPVSAPGSVRPSDLMLVALTERIAAKTRIRIEKEVEQHIQDTIFPLLDNFALQLVSHIQEDIVKIMRESIAQVTREELEWLRKRDSQK